MIIGLLRPTAFALALGFAAQFLPPSAARATEAPPDGFAAAYLAGHIAERRGDVNVAVAQLEAALKLAPETPTLRRRVLRLELAEGDFDAAIATADALAAEGDDNFPVGMTLLAARFRSGDFAGAQALAADPQANGIATVVALLGKAWAMAGAGEVDAGAKALTDAARDMPGLKVLLTLHAGLLAEQAGRLELARWMYEEAIAASKADERPASGRLIQIVAGFFERHELPEQAAEARAIEGADAEAPADTAAIGAVVASPADGFAEALFNFAGSLYGDRQYLQALIYARLSVALRPDSPATRFTIGQVLAASGRPAAAAAAYRATPRLGSYAWRAPIRVADSLADAGQIDAAIEAMRGVMAATPVSPEPAIALGHMLRGASKFPEAVVAYDEAIRRKGGLTDADGWLRYARGVALERSGDWTQAEPEFLKALETLGEEPLVLNYLGYTWIDRGERLDRARAMVARAVELRPDDGFIRDSLGWAEFRAGNFEAAAETLERAVALQPLDPIINEHLGDAYWHVGRIREARFQWRRALSFAPAADQIPLLENKLKCGLDGCPAAAPAKRNGDGG